MSIKIIITVIIIIIIIIMIIIIIIMTKVVEKLSKYKDLEIETTRMWGMRTKTVPVIVGAQGLIRKGMDQNLGKIPGASNILRRFLSPSTLGPRPE